MTALSSCARGRVSQEVWSIELHRNHRYSKNSLEPADTKSTNIPGFVQDFRQEEANAEIVILREVGRGLYCSIFRFLYKICWTGNCMVL